MVSLVDAEFPVNAEFPVSLPDQKTLVRKAIILFVKDERNLQGRPSIALACQLYLDLHRTDARTALDKGQLKDKAKRMLESMLVGNGDRTFMPVLIDTFHETCMTSPELALDEAQKVAVAKIASLNFYVTIVALAMDILSSEELDMKHLKELATNFKVEQPRLMPLMEALETPRGSNAARAVEPGPRE